MDTKTVTKTRKKIKIIPVLILLLVVFLLWFLYKLVTGIKIQNIYIFGNKYLSDDYIIEKAKLTNYPSYILTFRRSINNRLEDDDFIKSASTKKRFFGVVEITIEENRVLFYKEYSKKYVLEDKKEVDEIPYDYTATTIVNYIPDTVYDNFVTKYLKLDEDIISKISQIKYDPSDYDNSRFMFYMVDGNYVYVTTSKLDSINYYNDIYPTLEGRKGILYLDSGNHFVELK